MATQSNQTRKLLRYVESHYAGGWRVHVVSDEAWVFENTWGRMIGIYDKGDHYDGFDSANPNDTPEKPSFTLAKGKHVKRQHSNNN